MRQENATTAFPQKDVNFWAKSTGETPYQYIMRFSGNLKNKSQKGVIDFYES